MSASTHYQSQAKNLVEVFENSAKRNADSVCFRFVENGKWQSSTWWEVRESLIKLTNGLRKLGLKPGERVCILSKTRYEWTLADLAILAAGGIVVPIYDSNITEQVEFILEHAQASIIFVEDAYQLAKVQSVQKNLPHLKQIIVFDEIPAKSRKAGLYSFEEILLVAAEDGDSVYLEAIKGLKLSDEASYVYTSGTTGNPKGAVLTHGNFIAELKAGVECFQFQPHFESLIFLPLSHILARVVQFFQIYGGFIQCYAESIDRILDNIATVRPHFMASVPRIFEKIHSRTLQGVQSASPTRQKIFEWAMGVGRERSRLLLNGQNVPLALGLQYKLAHKLVFSKLHQKLGGRIEFFISGGAPLSSDISQFFHVFGFMILEGYGLTETTAAISVNRLDSMKIGSVGKPIANTTFKIANDGEILVKGDVVFNGYYKDPVATAEAIDADGWFHTGDIGEFDKEGFLKITDRKKDIIVTAAGKNVAPQNIENLMKTDPVISQFVVHGDKRKFLSALVTLEEGEIIKFAKQEKINFDKYEDLVRNDKVYQFVRQRIDEKNKHLAQYETIKRFAILPREFSVETGELTPSLKVKRKVVSQKYSDILDGFYN